MDHVIHGSFLKEKKTCHSKPKRPLANPRKTHSAVGIGYQTLAKRRRVWSSDQTDFELWTWEKISWTANIFPSEDVFFIHMFPWNFCQKKTRISYPKPSPPSPNQKPTNANPAPQKKTRPRNLAPSSQRFTPCWRRVSSKCSNQFSLGPFFRSFFLNELLEIVFLRKNWLNQISFQLSNLKLEDGNLDSSILIKCLVCRPVFPISI